MLQVATNQAVDQPGITVQTKPTQSSGEKFQASLHKVVNPISPPLSHNKDHGDLVLSIDLTEPIPLGNVADLDKGKAKECSSEEDISLSEKEDLLRDLAVKSNLFHSQHQLHSGRGRGPQTL